MRYFALFLMLLAVGMFACGCSGDTKEKDGKTPATSADDDTTGNDTVGDDDTTSGDDTTGDDDTTSGDDTSGGDDEPPTPPAGSN